MTPHAQALLRVSAPVAEGRLRSLGEHGVLRREAIFSDAPPAAWITRRGLDAIDSRLPVPRVDLKGYRHDIGVAWLWLAAQNGAFGQVAAQHSEREMRSHDRRPDRDGRAFGVGLGGVSRGGGERRHYPDLLLDLRGGQRVALELELTPKSVRRLDQIMLSYAVDARIDSVLYLVPDRPLLTKIESAARRAGIGEMIHVQRLAGGSLHGAPKPSGSRSLVIPKQAPERDGGREL